jgi:hypothetical protein
VPVPEALLKIRRPMFWLLDSNNRLRESSGGMTPEWVNCFAKHHRIGYDIIAERVVVSTVFLGVGHYPFETNVFGPDGASEILDGRRYLDFSSAEHGHKRVLEKWRRIVRG